MGSALVSFEIARAFELLGCLYSGAPIPPHVQGPNGNREY